MERQRPSQPARWQEGGGVLKRTRRRVASRGARMPLPEIGEYEGELNAEGAEARPRHAALPMAAFTRVSTRRMRRGAGGAMRFDVLHGVVRGVERVR